ncbi:DUF6348 family protein [Dysgonomonas sp. HGC4]|uniref:DUF6348 family protein n=1 Tax=Dysgonomonas sp. HGC4 TaxID=1658009 RepID=UPI0006814ED7|nr:DUF6348 family protein [Dysgonomonas sp. HGC4]MBD8348402.1 hypothetical protein [Dysgonomonas sp. HGC4]
MDINTLDQYEESAIKVIADLFRSHGVECLEESGILVFQKETITVDIRLFDRSSQTELKILQLDVRVKIGINCDIIESVAGFGDNYEIATKRALENFTYNSFHVIFSAFYTSSSSSSEVKKYNCTIGDKPFEVTMSNIGVRGKLPESFPTNWLDQFEEILQKQNLDEGIHWVRLFYAQQDNKMTTCEVLLDNDVWGDVLAHTTKLNWPKSENFFSVRVFMVLTSGTDIRRIAALIGGTAEYENVYENLKAYGLSDLGIEKAYSMIPEAFGRAFIESIGSGKFNSEAIIINDANEQFNIDLHKEAYYMQAFKLAQHIIQEGIDTNGKTLVMMSAALNAFDQALKAGEKPEDIDCSKFSLTFNIPLYKGNKISKYNTTNNTEIEKKKNFWKFWK